MSSSISVGQEAPNFDLSSTEDVVLMLQDEVVRTSVVLYFFGASLSERIEADLRSLSARRAELGALQTRAMAISPMKLPELKEVQQRLDLSFPLLRDDRDFSRLYGVAAPEDEEEAKPALVLVGPGREILWLANPVVSVGEALPELEKVLKGLPAPTAAYPRSVINRLVDRWVN